jgi:hypothetical protein
MKKYLKPVTDIEKAYAADLFMITISDDGGTIPGGGPGSGGGDAKDRDLEEEEIIQILEEQENGGNSNLW